MYSSKLALLGLMALAACSGDRPAETSSSMPTPAAPASTAVLYEGARLIPGDGSAPIERAAFIVDGGIITHLGTAGQLAIPAGAARVDLSGKTVMPALIGAHGHVGYQRGASLALDNYTRETIYDDLRRATYFGLGTVMTLGIDRGDLIYEIRQETAAGTAGVARLKTAGRGIGGPNTGPGNPVYARGIAYEVVTVEEGLAAVRETASYQPDIVKIWLDERDGRGQKLSHETALAIIEEARRLGFKVTAHIRTHEDAEFAVNSGVYSLSHLVQDHEMDDALIAAMVERGVYITPTLSMAERNVYAGDVPQWLREPALASLLSDTLSADVLAGLHQSFVDRAPAAAENMRDEYAIMHANVGKLNAAGARIVLGADTGLFNHFWGYAEHRELELLVAAGLTPMQAIVAGTARAAEYLELPNLGLLAPGNIADFLVLDANPLDDITNTRRIDAVYLRGAAVDRAALRRAWAAQ